MVERLLKQDLLGRVELIRNATGLAVQRVPSRLPLVRTVARFLIARERRALKALSGLRNVPAALEHQDKHGCALRSWLPGRTLSEASELPRNFFDQLEELVGKMHRRGVCHNDLHKEGNILVGDDGSCAVIDFQIASVHHRQGRSFRLRAAEDLRHVRKHRRIYCKAMGRPDARDLPVPPPRLLSRAWRLVWKPLYNSFLRRSGMRKRLRSGEHRRRAADGWPVWVDPIDTE